MMSTSWRCLASCACLISLIAVYFSIARSEESVTADLEIPAVTEGRPGPGKRVVRKLAQWEGTAVHHVLYLPVNWEPNQKYPVIVEYAGNQYKDSLGTVEGSKLGYGLTGGKNAIWLCLPYVDPESKQNALHWWGDPDETVKYCLEAVSRTCREYGGDRDRLILAGFSRGSIGCNYIGLRNDKIAELWCGFICHSHYDGLRKWRYPESSPEEAVARLQRLNGRPQWISAEFSLEPTKTFLKKAAPDGNFTFRQLATKAHTDAWVLEPSEDRNQLRQWYQSVIN